MKEALIRISVFFNDQLFSRVNCQAQATYTRKSMPWVIPSTLLGQKISIVFNGIPIPRSRMKETPSAKAILLIDEILMFI